MQDYTEEFREITKGSKSKEALPAGSITLINQRPVGEDLHVKFCLHVTHTTRQSLLIVFNTIRAHPRLNRLTIPTPTSRSVSIGSIDRENEIERERLPAPVSLARDSF